MRMGGYKMLRKYAICYGVFIIYSYYGMISTCRPSPPKKSRYNFWFKMTWNALKLIKNKFFDLYDLYFLSYGRFWSQFSSVLTGSKILRKKFRIKRCALFWNGNSGSEIFFVRFFGFELWLILYLTVSWVLDFWESDLETLTSDTQKPVG